jgi:Domain of unknown function (DUF4062)
MKGTTMKVFLSSTYVDLIEFRKAAVEALERLGQQVGRMEIFGARPMEPSDACLSEIEDCDLFVGIYAHRYGHVPDGSTVSISEAEIRHARTHNKAIFCFVVEDNHPWPPEMIESEPGRTKLIALKAEISSSLVRDTFTTPENLALKIATSVGRYLIQPSYPLLPPPQMQIVSPGSYFGRFDSEGGRFAPLLKVKFRNKSAQPVLLQRFRIQYTDRWYPPASDWQCLLIRFNQHIYRNTPCGRQHHRITPHTRNGREKTLCFLHSAQSPRPLSWSRKTSPHRRSDVRATESATDHLHAY